MLSLPPLLQRRFVFVTGKGGVGKSTVAATLAHLSAAAGRRTLVCELNTQERIPALFGRPASGDTVTALAENLWSVNIKPATAMEEYGLMKLRFRALYRIVFDNPVVQSMVRFVPGVNDLVMLGKAFHHERERDAKGEPVWDTIIVDAPATGHGLTFFKLPQVIRDAVPKGNMHDEAAAMAELLTDPERTAVHLVSLPEALPVQETLELHERLTHGLDLPLGYLVMNMMPERPLDAAASADFAQLRTCPTDPALAALWTATRISAARVEAAKGCAARLKVLKCPQVPLPVLVNDVFGPDEIARLSEAFLKAAWAVEGT